MDDIFKTESFDIEKIIAELGLDAETTISLLKVLLHETRMTNEKLRQAAENGNYKDVTALAHDIKGSCGNFRLTDLYEIAAAVEKMGKNQGEINEIVEISFEIGRRINLYSEIIGKYDGTIKSNSY